MLSICTGRKVRTRGTEIEYKAQKPRNEPDLFHVVESLHGLHHRSYLLINIKLHAHSRQRSKNVTEQNASVRLVISPRLQRNLHSHFGNFTSLPKRRVLFAQFTIFLYMTTSLAHHPDWNTFGGFATGSANEERVDGVARRISVCQGERLGCTRCGRERMNAIADAGEEHSSSYKFHS